MPSNCTATAAELLYVCWLYTPLGVGMSYSNMERNTDVLAVLLNTWEKSVKFIVGRFEALQVRI